MPKSPQKVAPEPVAAKALASDHVFLVDGSSYIFRAYHALPPLLAIVFDKSEVTFRNKLYADYKAHRPPAPDDLIPQFALIRDAVRALDLPCLEQNGYEADDLIATYARQANERGATTTIVALCRGGD
jgi:DNA polymerase-1